METASKVAVKAEKKISKKYGIGRCHGHGCGHGYRFWHIL